MRKKSGSHAPPIKLQAIDGSAFDTKSLKGRPFMLSFFRFAGCPFCNLRIHELSKRYSQLGEGFEIVAVFDSPLKNLMRHIEGHRAQFPVLADERINTTGSTA